MCQKSTGVFNQRILVSWGAYWTCYAFEHETEIAGLVDLAACYYHCRGDYVFAHVRCSLAGWFVYFYHYLQNGFPLNLDARCQPKNRLHCPLVRIQIKGQRLSLGGGMRSAECHSTVSVHCLHTLGSIYHRPPEICSYFTPQCIVHKSELVCFMCTTPQTMILFYLQRHSWQTSYLLSFSLKLEIWKWGLPLRKFLRLNWKRKFFWLQFLLPRHGKIYGLNLNFWILTTERY